MRQSGILSPGDFDALYRGLRVQGWSPALARARVEIIAERLAIWAELVDGDHHERDDRDNQRESGDTG